MAARKSSHRAVVPPQQRKRVSSDFKLVVVDAGALWVAADRKELLRRHVYHLSDKLQINWLCFAGLEGRFNARNHDRDVKPSAILRPSCHCGASDSRDCPVFVRWNEGH